MRLKPELTVQQLLKRFPKGFLVSPTGLVYEVVREVNLEGLPPVDNGGYIAARIPEVMAGDEEYLMAVDSLNGKTASQAAEELRELITRLEAMGATADDWAKAYEVYEKYRGKLPE